MAKKPEKKQDHRIVVRGPLQVGDALSLNPISIQEMTTTRQYGEQVGNSGMAPLARKVVEFGLYAMPYAFDPNSVESASLPFIKNDLALWKAIVPHAYALTASSSRPVGVEVLKAYHVTHRGPMGGASDWSVIDALTPKKKLGADVIAKSIDDYDFVNEDLSEMATRLKVAKIEELCENSEGEVDITKRQLGLIIIGVRWANPNGDPDSDGRPRQPTPDGTGVITGVSFTRKWRDIIINKSTPAWKLFSERLGLKDENYLISEDRHLDKEIYKSVKSDKDKYLQTYADCRLKGATDLNDRTAIKAADVEDEVTDAA